MSERTENRKNKKRKVVKFWRTFFIILLLFMAGGFIGISVYLGSAENAVKAIGMALNYGKTIVTKEPPFDGKKNVNILVFGVDVPFGGGVRTDTIKLVHLNVPEKKISVLSIPRDIWTDLPNGSRNRINTAHKLGGQDAELSINYTVWAVKHLLEKYVGEKVPIDYYVRIHTHQFAELIDSIGGVEIDVEKKMRYSDTSQELFIDLEPGLQLLNGYDAMCYSRFRMDNEGDWGRIRRQDQVIRAISGKIQNDTRAINAKSSAQMLKIVRTNLGVDDILGIKDIVTSGGGMDNMFSLTLSAEEDVIAKADILRIVDEDKARREIRDIIDYPRTRILIINSNKNDNHLSLLPEKFYDEEVYNLRHYTPANTKTVIIDGKEMEFQEATTAVYSKKDNHSKAIAEELKTALGISKKSVLRDKILFPGDKAFVPDANNPYDVMIVLHDEYFKNTDGNI